MDVEQRWPRGLLRDLDNLSLEPHEPPSTTRISSSQPRGYRQKKPHGSQAEHAHRRPRKPSSHRQDPNTSTDKPRAKTATRYWPPKNPSSSASTAHATNSRALPQTAISSKSIACLTKRTRIYSATTSLALGLMWRRARFRRIRGLGGLSLGIRRRRTRLLERALGSMLWLGISF
jgi:hypothetical protein